MFNHLNPSDRFMTPIFLLVIVGCWGAMAFGALNSAYAQPTVTTVEAMPEMTATFVVAVDLNNG